MHNIIEFFSVYSTYLTQTYSPRRISIIQKYQSDNIDKLFHTLIFHDGNKRKVDNTVFSYFPDGERNKLTAVFLESPRISETVVSNLFFTTDEPLWPYLQVVSICNFNEITAEHLTILTAGKHLQFLRFSACQNLMLSAVKKWQRLNEKYNVLLYVD